MKSLVVHEIMQPAHTWPLANSMSNALFAQNCKNEEFKSQTRHDTQVAHWVHWAVVMFVDIVTELIANIKEFYGPVKLDGYMMIGEHIKSAFILE